MKNNIPSLGPAYPLLRIEKSSIFPRAFSKQNGADHSGTEHACIRASQHKHPTEKRQSIRERSFRPCVSLQICVSSSPPPQLAE